MDKSIEELRGLIKKLREDIARVPASASQPVSESLEAAPILPPPADRISDVEPEPLYTPEPPMLPTLKERSTPEESFTARVLFWRRCWSVACLIAAAAGAYGGHGLVLAGGLLGAAIGVAAGFWASSLAGGEDEIEDLVHRVDVLERRLASLGRPSSPGGIPPGLEEDIRELRRILLAMIKSWETSQAGPPEEEQE